MPRRLGHQTNPRVARRGRPEVGGSSTASYHRALIVLTIYAALATAGTLAHFQHRDV